MGREWEQHDDVEVDATPQQVWEAIATGPGYDSWYMGRTEVEPGEGGAVRTDLGGYVMRVHDHRMGAAAAVRLPRRRDPRTGGSSPSSSSSRGASRAARCCGW